MIHSCAECGLMHDHATPPAPDPAVEIARIEAESRLAIARLESRAGERMAESYAEAEAAAAEAEAAADVAVAEVQAEAIAAVYEDATPEPPEPEAPVIIEQDNEGDELAPPPAEPAAEPAAEPRKRGLGLW